MGTLALRCAAVTLAVAAVTLGQAAPHAVAAPPTPTVTVAGTTSEDGRTVDYRVNVVNPAGTAWEKPITLDLTDLLDDAVLIPSVFGDIFTIISTYDPSVQNAERYAPAQWTLDLDSVDHETNVATIADTLDSWQRLEVTFSARVHGRGDGALAVTAQVSGGADTGAVSPEPGTPAATDSDVQTLSEPRLSVHMTHAVANGQATTDDTDAGGGDIVSYQVIVTNTGQRPYFDPVIVDLSDVLDDAVLETDSEGNAFTVVTTVGPNPVGAPVHLSAEGVQAGVFAFATGGTDPSGNPVVTVPGMGAVVLDYRVRISDELRDGGNGVLVNVAAAPDSSMAPASIAIRTPFATAAHQEPDLLYTGDTKPEDPATSGAADNHSSTEAAPAGPGAATTPVVGDADGVPLFVPLVGIVAAAGVVVVVLVRRRRAA